MFVPYGAPLLQASVPTITCDGLVPGAALQLTHWTNNDTPEELYADTSTEIAFNFLKSSKYAERYEKAGVVNNHYDGDGVFSAFALLEPEKALQHEELLTAAAAVGDFGESPSEEAVKLNAAIETIGAQHDDDEMAYEHAFRLLPEMLDNLDAFSDLYEASWDAINDGYRALHSGKVTIELCGDVAIVREPCDAARLAPEALHRGLCELGADGLSAKACQRVVRARRTSHSDEYLMEVEKPGHGWVKRLARRQTIMDADGGEMAETLNRAFDLGDTFQPGGEGGLVALCKTATGVRGVTPLDVADFIREHKL